MPNLAATLKEEIRRLAKKEVKAETSKTKRAVAQYRREIARLKRDLQSNQKQIARLKVQGQKGLDQLVANGEPEDAVRFSARSVQAQRKRIGLSAANYGKLIGVSGLTVYNWENGKSRPRKAQLDRLVAVRGIGKREAAKKLEMLKAEQSSGAGRARKAISRKSA
jgi:DNA-binding transcriptional regulator YiaG